MIVDNAVVIDNTLHPPHSDSDLSSRDFDRKMEKRETEQVREIAGEIPRSSASSGSQVQECPAWETDATTMEYNATTTGRSESQLPVSYTHLTLPTILRV